MLLTSVFFYRGVPRWAPSDVKAFLLIGNMGAPTERDPLQNYATSRIRSRFVGAILTFKPAPRAPAVVTNSLRQRILGRVRKAKHDLTLLLRYFVPRSQVRLITARTSIFVHILSR